MKKYLLVMLVLCFVFFAGAYELQQGIIPVDNPVINGGPNWPPDGG